MEGEERPWIHTGLNVLLIVVAVVVVGGLLWMRIGPKPAPCNGAPSPRSWASSRRSWA